MATSLLRPLLFAALASAQACCFAATPAPEAVLDAVMADVMPELRHESERPEGAGKLPQWVEARMLELFDFPRMTQMALAHNWRLTSPLQRELLTTEFKSLLVRTLCTVIADYGDELGEFKHWRLTPDEVRIRSELRQDGRERMSVDYDMERSVDGWKVYDVKFGGVSLMAMFRESFAAAVRDEGIDGLIKSLAEANSQVSSAAIPRASSLAERNRIVFAILHSALRGRR